jgi:hypothetical protein
MARQCEVVEDGQQCGKPLYAKGMCNMHRRRWQRHGDPLVVLPRGGAKCLLGVRGPDHPSWQGDDITYLGAHARLRRGRGNASEYTCPCGAQACEWSYQHGCPAEQQSDRGPYCTHLDCYEPLCISCHRRKDGTSSQSNRAI